MKQSSINGQMLTGFLLTSFCLSLGSLAVADVRTCVQDKWYGVIHKQADIKRVFDIPSITARAIGPLYKTLGVEVRQAAHLATTYSLKETLEKNLGSLRKLRLEISGAPQVSKNKYGLSGAFVGTSGRSYTVQAWVRKDDCKIIAMVIEAGWLKDWLRKTTTFQTFLRKNEL
jgi:hypothetical protein